MASLLLCFLMLGASTLLAQAPNRQTPAQRFDEAQKAIADGRFELAVRICNELLAEDQRSSTLWFTLGLAQYQQGAYRAAAPALRKATDLEPGLAVAHAFLGLSEAAQGNYEGSLTPLETAFRAELSPEFRRLVGIQLGKTYIQQLRPGDSEQVYARLLKEFPTDAEILYHSFWLHMTQGRELMRALVRASPESYRTHQLLGYLLLDKENYEPAAAQFRMALKANPAAPGLHYELGNALLATAKTAEDHAHAREEFEQELRRNPAHASACNRLGDIALAEQQFAKAAEWYQKALQIDAGHAASLVGLCKLSVQQNHLDEALRYCEKAVKADPEYGEARYRLAHVYQALGRSADAARELASFKKLDEEARRESQYLMGARLGVSPGN